MAKSVVYFVADYILQYVGVASYTSRKSNTASISTAQSIGFKYCTNIVNNDKWCANNPRLMVNNVECHLIKNL